MSVDRLHELWTKYLAEGVLLPVEEQELIQAFGQNPALAEQLLGDVEIDGLLRTLPENPSEADASAARFLDCVSAEKDADRFVDRVFTKLTNDAPPAPIRAPRQATHRATRRTIEAARPIPWREIAIAAGVLIAIGILYAVLSPSPAAPPRRTPEIVRPRETPAPEPPAPLPAPEKEKAPEPREPEPTPAPVPAPPESKDPVPPPAPKPVPVPVKPAEKVDPPAPKTITAVAALEKVEGDVFIVTAAGRAPAKSGDGVPAGESVETYGPAGAATVKFADGTRLALGADTLISEIVDRQPSRGRRVLMVRGSMAAEIPKQPADQPMAIATPHGEARILGTTIRLDVGKTTRLEVKEGRVRFTRADGKKSVEVAPGQFTLAGPGTDPVVKLLSQERKILFQWDFDGPNSGTEWERGTIDRTQTFAASRGSLKAAFRPDADYAMHAGLAYMAKPLPVTVTERTSITFSYFISAPVEMKLQMRADRTKPTRTNIGFIIESPKANAWTTVTVKFTESFRQRVGLGDLVKPGITELDDLQFHAAPGDKPVELFIDNVAIFE